MSGESTLKSKIQKALAERLFKQNPSPRAHSDNRSYVENPQDVLVKGVELSAFRADFDKGDGGELQPLPKRPPKFHAAHSSSALAANTFGLYRQNQGGLVFAGYSGFTALQFEFQCPTGAGQSWGSGLWILVFNSIKPSNNRERLSLRLSVDAH